MSRTGLVLSAKTLFTILVHHHLHLNTTFRGIYRFFCTIRGRRARSLKEIKNKINGHYAHNFKGLSSRV